MLLPLPLQLLLLLLLLPTAGVATSAPVLGLLLPSCFIDRTSPRQLPHEICEKGDGICTALSRESCGSACHAAGFPVAGVEAGHYCCCGHALLNASAAVPAQQCGSPCTGNVSETCGGSLRLYAYAARRGPPPPPPPLLALSAALSSSMVLQRAPARARLWGTAIAGAAVTVLAGVATATAGVDGRWSLLLPPQPAGPAFGTGTIVISSQGTNVTLTDVHMGEVWLCTGQSNMGLPLGGIGAGDDGHEKLVSWSGAVSWGLQELNWTSRYPLVRVTGQGTPTQDLSCSLYNGRQRCSRDTPMEDATASQWRVPSKANMYGFSGLCWMYGRRLSDYLQEEEGKVVPVGLVQIAVGGTAVELWSSAEALAKCDQDRGDQMAPCQDPENSTMYHETTYTNSTLYNSMLHPWTQLAARGAIWYACIHAFSSERALGVQSENVLRKLTLCVL